MNSSASTASHDCCSGVADATPRGVANAPGLDTVGYRIGAQADFKAAMLDALSQAAAGPLRALQTREDDDFTVALLDAWATTLDVLTFYQERLANEGWLGTAADRRSVVELARLIGYEPRPGLAAEAALVFTLEDAAGAPRTMTLDPGVAVQSIPAPGETSVTFETVEPLELRPEWNALRPRQYEFPVPLDPSARFYWVDTAAPGVKPGDVLLIFTRRSLLDGTTERYRCLKRLVGVVPDPAANRARLQIEDLLAPIKHDELVDDAIIVLGTKAAPFGHNAPLPQLQTLPAASVTVNATIQDWHVVDWGNKVIVLDRDVENIPSRAALALVRPALNGSWNYYAVNPVATVSKVAFGMSVRATQLEVYDPSNKKDPWITARASFQDWRDTTFYIETRRLPLAGAPVGSYIMGDSIVLDRDYYVYPQQQGEFDHPVPPASRVGHYPPAFQPGRRWVLRGQGFEGIDGAESFTVTSAEQDKATGLTRLHFSPPLVAAYRPPTVTLTPNVVRATHGETVGEILGGGNGGQGWQQFTLRQGPLTYTGDGVASGGASTLEIQANGLIWREQPSFVEAGPGDRVFTTATDENARTVVRFGDGRNGARLPSGINNVRATYRKGSGAAGNVDAGQLTLLGSRPAGVRAVVNPLPANGGVDPEGRDDARRNVPMTARTLDRIVSLQDYADYARAFAGIARADARETAGRVLLSLVGPGGAKLTLQSAAVVRLAAALRQLGDPTVPVQIVGGRLFLLAFGATLRIAPDRVPGDVLAAARAALVARFGFDHREFGDLLAQIDLLATLQGTPGVLAAAITRFEAPGSDNNTAIWPDERDGSLLLPAWIAWLDESQLQLTVS